MDFLILALACSVGVYLTGMFTPTVLGFIPASFGGTSGAAAGTTPSPYIAAFASGLIIAAVVAAAGHLHGRVGEGIKEAA